MNKLIVILGPTASGKTDLAVFLAKKLKGEVVSADSRQIYKEMDIGTAKVTKKEITGVPHYLIDIIPPNKTFTLAQYKTRTIKSAARRLSWSAGQGFTSKLWLKIFRFRKSHPIRR